MPEAGMGLRSLVIPLEGNEGLLLPSAVVAEVTYFGEPDTVTEGPDWVVGTFDWRRRQIPLLSMEKAMSTTPPENYGYRARVAVLYAFECTAQMPFYGIVTKGIPQVFRADKDTVQPRENGNDMPTFVLSRVRLKGGGDALIPDLDRLQNQLLPLFSS